MQKELEQLAQALASLGGSQISAQMICQDLRSGKAQVFPYDGEHRAIPVVLRESGAVPTSRSINTGVGLSGGGALTSDLTLTLDLNGLTSDTPVLTDQIAFNDVSESDTPNKCTIAVLNGVLEHDSLSGYLADEHIDWTNASDDLVTSGEIHGTDLYGDTLTLASSFALVVDDSNNASVIYPHTVTHTTSATPAAGIGVGMKFRVETSAGNTETGGSLEFLTTDVTSTSEDFDFVLKLMAGGAAAAEALRVTSDYKLSFAGDTDTYLTRPAANTLAWSTGGTERMRIDSSGNVGIGGTASYPLHVFGGGDQIAVESSGSVSDILFKDTGTSIGQVRVRSASNTLQFLTNTTVRMRIDSSGRLNVNQTANPFAYNASLGVLQNGRSAAMSVNADGTGGTNILFQTVTNGGVGSITTTSSATAYNTSSDRRLKTNISDIPDAQAAQRIMQLKPRLYDWIAHPEEGRQLGFIADELQSIIPQAVTGEPNAVDSHGNPIYQQVDYSKLTPVLTAALQGAIRKINQLEARIAVLEANP